MQAFRLDSVAPAVAAQFRRASSTKRVQAALVACEYAVASAGLIEQLVDRALDVLRGVAVPQSLVLEQLKLLAAKYDEEYLQLDADADPATRQAALGLFSKARALSALAFALSPNDAELHEAIYEATAVMDDPGELLRAVNNALK